MRSDRFIIRKEGKMDSGFEYINDLTVQGTVVGTKIGENYLSMTIATTQTRV